MKITGPYRDLVGRLVRTNREIHLVTGKMIPAGALARIASTWRGRFVLEEPERGDCLGMNVIVRGIHPAYFDLIE